MARYPKDISDEELKIRKEQSKIRLRETQKKAKQKYNSSEKGRACTRKYYEKNREKIIETNTIRRRERMSEKKQQLDMLERFFFTHVDEHDDFFRS